MPRPIESLRRGLEVMQLLIESSTPVPLHALHRITSIPKPSLLSILATLESEGLAQETDLGWTLSSEWIAQIQTFFLRRILINQKLRRLSYGAHQDAEFGRSGPGGPAPVAQGE